MNSTNEMYTQPVQTWTRFFIQTSELFWSANKMLFTRVGQVDSAPELKLPISVPSPVPEAPSRVLQAVAPKSAALVRKSKLAAAAPKSKSSAPRKGAAVKRSKSRAK